ncbi:MAG: UbiA family prenyltransferase [Chitinispirillales bacterium]|jgi:4-hydroxybenzoate polyprenyltransferase|nr:UbiA family prenyltransferase [Chitinispirillales bacterium]
MNKKILLAIDLLFLTRPVVIAPVWGFGAFGVYCVNKGLFTQLELPQYLLMFLYSLSAASAYVFNQIADYEVDKRNGGFPLLVRGDIPIGAAWACSAACGLASIAGPLLMGHWLISVLSLTAITAGCLYSFKPFSLSGRPVFDFLTNAFEAFLAFSAGWAIAGGGLSSPLLYASALPYFLLMCAGSIGSTLPDMAGDGECGKATTAVTFGGRAAHRIALGLLIIAIPASIFLSNDFLALSCALIAVPTYIPFLISSSKPAYMELTYKVGGSITMIAASLAVPMLLPAGITVFLMTRVYFRMRHGVSYPSLKPNNASRGAPR